ncbi:hypothetical protein V1498_09240 [Peribacillus sp. SCS-26]|uniref:hypothetical protein n=1 Tax=Paraperibacillus marinus TaxID=3115295 RepID=UPI003906A9CE
MEPTKPGNDHLPDFKELDDRFIGEKRMSGPSLVIETKLDSQSVTESNPYMPAEDSKADKKDFRNYFEDDSYE